MRCARSGSSWEPLREASRALPFRNRHRARASLRAVPPCRGAGQADRHLPATIDRVLTHDRKRLQLKGRSGTKLGSLLKTQIPKRTFAEWDETGPAFCETDLVAHDGGNSPGEFCQTLNLTDVAIGWTEVRAVKNRAQRWVFEALIDIEQCLPFAPLGIDSDNGVEFINDQLLRYCTEHEITFTRTGLSKERQLLHRAEELDGGTPVGGLRALRGRGRAGDSQ
jgi:hypothetical protein